RPVARLVRDALFERAHFTYIYAVIEGLFPREQPPDAAGRRPHHHERGGSAERASEGAPPAGLLGTRRAVRLRVLEADADVADRLKAAGTALAGFGGVV